MDHQQQLAWDQVHTNLMWSWRYFPPTEVLPIMPRMTTAFLMPHKIVSYCVEWVEKVYRIVYHENGAVQMVRQMRQFGRTRVHFFAAFSLFSSMLLRNVLLQQAAAVMTVRAIRFVWRRRRWQQQQPPPFGNNETHGSEWIPCSKGLATIIMTDLDGASGRFCICLWWWCTRR
jgi:hypothetical protein